MKDIIFYSKDQNVYKQYTGVGSRVMTDMLCIAVSKYEAEKIVSAMNACKTILTTNQDTVGTFLMDIKYLAMDATQ